MCLSYLVGIHSISFWYQFFCVFYSMWKLIATLRHMIKKMYGVTMQPTSSSHISRQGVMGLWCPLNIFYFIFGKRDLLNLPTKLGSVVFVGFGKVGLWCKHYIFCRIILTTTLKSIASKFKFGSRKCSLVHTIY